MSPPEQPGNVPSTLECAPPEGKVLHVGEGNAAEDKMSCSPHSGISNQNKHLGRATAPLGLEEKIRKKKLILGVACIVLVVTSLAVALGVGLSDSSSDNASDDVSSGAVTTESSTFCGEGYVGNGTCANGLCCSYYGFCGFSPDHCVNGQEPPSEDELHDPNRFCGGGFPGNGTCQNSTLCCSHEGKCEYSYHACGYWPYNTTRGRPCGFGDIGDGECEDPEAECCSQWGYCGTTEDHCLPWPNNEEDNDGNRKALRGLVAFPARNGTKAGRSLL